jgi:hypothetical protein
MGYLEGASAAVETLQCHHPTSLASHFVIVVVVLHGDKITLEMSKMT